MGMVCVYSTMSGALAGNAEMAGGDFWGLELSGGSSLTYLVPSLG